MRKKSTPVVHPHAVLTYYTRGHARLWCGSVYSVNAGDFLLIPEGTPHYPVEIENVEIYILCVCISCMTSVAGSALASIFQEVSQGSSAARTTPAAAREHLLWIFEGLNTELASSSRSRGLAIEGYLSLLAALVQRSSPILNDANEHAAGHTIAARALAFITRNATRGISLQEVAQHVGRSLAHTASVIKMETGQTAVQWITHARLAAARQLLIQSDATVETVAFRVGFASPSHFYRVFKRLHTMTPAAWRKKHIRHTAQESPYVTHPNTKLV